MPSVALVTCTGWPELHDDDRPVLGLLAERGVDAEPVVWDDPAVDWDAYDLAVVRSTWDYWTQRDRFVAWARRVPRLANSAAIVEWNTDKRYLADLAGAGVPTIATTYVSSDGDAFELPPGDVVVKPTVGAGAYEARRFAATDADAARRHVAALTAGGATAMVQPHLGAVDSEGETACVSLGGEYSHAARKAAILTADGTKPGEQALEEMRPRVADHDELEVARGALAALPERCLYARVDLLRDDDGRPVVLEVEVTEPSLFLDIGAAHARLADAVVGWLTHR